MTSPSDAPGGSEKMGEIDYRNGQEHSASARKFWRAESMEYCTNRSHIHVLEKGRWLSRKMGGGGQTTNERNDEKDGRMMNERLDRRTYDE